MGKDLYKAREIVSSLLNDLQSEEADLNSSISERLSRIEDLDSSINIYRRNDDVDFRVFSPRNMSGLNADKIAAMEKEKDALEREKKEASRQLNYYSDKINSLKAVYTILDNYIDSETIEVSKDDYAEDDESVGLQTDDSTDDVTLDEDPRDDYAVSEEDVEAEDANNKDSEDDSVNSNVSAGVPLEEIERVLHKVELTERIVTNDGMRSKIQLKEVISILKEFIKTYF